jgi:aspartyl-tRNA(Asn)/glutamyl-tRNA(Gln) amidotransferase subunit A
MHTMTACQINELFISGKASAEEIARFFLQRISKYDDQVGSFLSTYEDRVVARAKALDEKRKKKEKLGLMAAIPVAIKDNINIAHERTSCGSKFLENYTATFDASVTTFLEEQDALILGKTNLDEFAMGSSTETSAFKKTKNPWNLDCTPGGSSGGSAAAVAARLAAVSLGSDTGGSIRQPAAFTGTVGFKPTYGRVSRYGLVAFASSLDQIGPITHCVEDAALTMQVIAQSCPKDATHLQVPAHNYLQMLSPSMQNMRIGVPWHFLEKLSAEARKNFEESLKVCTSLGATVVDVNLDILSSSIAVYYILATAEASTNLARFDGIRYGKRSQAATSLEEVYDLSRQEGFGSEVKNRILLGTYVLSSGYKDAYYTKAQKVRKLMIDAFEKAYGLCDIIMMPTSPFPAFKLGQIQDPIQMYLQDIYTIAANLVGAPAISIPSGFSATGLPLGMQIMGPAMQDGKVLSAAFALEKAIGISNKIPPLFDDIGRS